MLLHRLPYDDWFDDELPDLAPSSVEPSEVSDIPEGGGTTRKDQLIV